jgi:hypothetical protein
MSSGFGESELLMMFLSSPAYATRYVDGKHDPDHAIFLMRSNAFADQRSTIIAFTFAQSVGHEERIARA